MSRDRRPWMPWPFQDVLATEVFGSCDATDIGAIVLLAARAWMTGGSLDSTNDTVLARWSMLSSNEWIERKQKIMPALQSILPYLSEEYGIYNRLCDRNRKVAVNRWDKDHDTSGSTNGSTNGSTSGDARPSRPSRPTVPPTGLANPPTVHQSYSHRDGDGACAPVSGTRTGTKKSPRVTVHDLVDDKAFKFLYVKAKRLNWIDSSENDREAFFAAAACALRRAKASEKPADPGDIFMWVLHGHRDAIADEDFQTGHARSKKLAGGEA